MFNSGILLSKSWFLNSKLVNGETALKIKLKYLWNYYVMKFHIIFTSCTKKNLGKFKTFMK